MLPCCATWQVPRKYWRGNVVINIHVTDGTPAQVELELRGTEPGKGLGCRCFGEPHGDVKQHRLAKTLPVPTSKKTDGAHIIFSLWYWITFHLLI